MRIYLTSKRKYGTIYIMGNIDSTSKKAFEITKNVTESCLDTIVDVRSGGLVSELQKEIKTLQSRLNDLGVQLRSEKYIVKQRNKRIGELNKANRELKYG